MPNFGFHIRHGNHSSDHDVDLPDVRLALAQRPFSLLRPGVMGPCVRRDDPLRACARPRPINARLNSVICDSPAQGSKRELPALLIL
jgi:hypothetical protein